MLDVQEILSCHFCHHLKDTADFLLTITKSYHQTKLTKVFLNISILLFDLDYLFIPGLEPILQVRESSFNMTRGGGGMKILREGSENF